MEEAPDPWLLTPKEEYSGAEKAKLAMPGMDLVIRDLSHPANLHHQFRDTTGDDLADVAETLAKSYGIYLQFNRARRSGPRDWRYMLRITIPGGGPLRRSQWEVLDEVAERFTTSESYTGAPEPSLRATTRQNLQVHWVRKRDLVDAIQTIAKSGFYTLNGCGDNVRNIVACPLSTSLGVHDANAWAQRIGRYFRLPKAAYLEVFEIDPEELRQPGEGPEDPRFSYAPNLLNRKFKIALSSVLRDPATGALRPDNCVEARTDDVGIVPVVRDGDLSAFQVYVGGGQGERLGHATVAVLGEPLGIVAPEDLLAGLDAIVAVHQRWGDRKNRHWARLKYVIRAQGVEWFRDRVRELSSVAWAPPDPLVEPGPRQMHHGWTPVTEAGDLAYGLFVENGRIINGPNGRLRSLTGRLMARFDPELYITPNQDLIFLGIEAGEKQAFLRELADAGVGVRHGQELTPLRMLSGACVGRDTCRLAYTDSEKFEPQLIDQLESRWGSLAESIGITGCERQCFRPATKTIGWVGAGYNLYGLRLGGTEDGRHQGRPFHDPSNGERLLQKVPRNAVAAVTEALFELYVRHRRANEAVAGGMGYFLRRVGEGFVLSELRRDPRVAPLLLPAKELAASSSPAGAIATPPGVEDEA